MRHLLNCAQTVHARLGPELRPRCQVHERPGHEEDHHDVEDRGQTQGEGEAAHLSDRENVQHRGGDEADRVAGQDGATGTRPAARHCGAEAPALADLVLDAFEEDHERVRGHTDTDDQARDSGEVECEPDVPAEEHHHRVDREPGQDQRQRGEDAEHAVVDQAEQEHQDQSDGAGDQTRFERSEAEGGRDGLGFRCDERQRQRAVLERVREFAAPECW